MTCATKRRFAPQIAPGNSELTPPSSVAPVWVRADTVTFTYPYTSPTLTLELRAPDLGDSTTTNVKRLNNTTRGGKQIYYRDSEWPVSDVLEFGFSGLTDVEVASLFTFLDESLGKEIGFLDWLGQEWRGIIIDPSGAQVMDGPSCASKMGIVFRGRRV